MKVLLTGAGGFLGSHLARLLVAQGCEVHALLRPGGDPWRLRDLLPHLHLIQGDLLDPAGDWAAQVRSLRPDLCFHFAWYAEPGVFLTSPLNLKYLAASLALAENLALAGCPRLVVAGSFSEYDQDLGHLSEDAPLRPNTLYGACKAALHQALALWAPAAGVSLLWTRLFSLYGPMEHPKRFVPAVILAALRGEPTRLSPGAQVRDYLHAADAAAAVWHAAQAGLTGALNIGSGQGVAIGALAQHIGEITGRPDLIRLGDLPYRPGDPMLVVADTRRLQAAAWTPRFDLDTGLRNTVVWWRDSQISDLAVNK